MNREYGKTVMVRLDRELHEKLCDMKIIPQEPFNDCIARILIENEKLKLEKKGLDIIPVHSQETPSARVE